MNDDVSKRLDDISGLEYNWDGYGASVPEPVIVNNARTFIDTLTREGYVVEAEDVYPTAYGSIIIDVYNGEDYVSIEIGVRQIGWYTRLGDSIDNVFESDGMGVENDFDFGFIPQELIDAFDAIFKKI